ncbi:MAG: RIP metalloprotease RseP [Neisseria sp.]|nr:RIP metalloprotease RseP [Neisseria sp.]
MLTLLAFVVAILILVSVHELGHFAVARLFNIKVTRFSIGFGKPFWKKKYGDTEWCLAPIPLGGYVKMVDTREGEVAPEDLPYAFDRQHPAKRMAVVVAGPLVNLMLAVVFFAAAAMFGVTETKAVIGTVLPDTIAARAGLQPGERVLAVNGEAVADFGDMQTQIVFGLDRGNVQITAENTAGTVHEYTIDADKEAAARTQIARGKALFGVMPDKLTNTLKYVSEQGAAYRAGLRDGDVIVALDGVAHDSWLTITEKVRLSPGRSIAVTYLRNGQTLHADVLPYAEEERPDAPLVGKIGTWWAEDAAWRNSVNHTYHPNFAQALQLGAQKTVDYSWLTLKFFGRMLIGQASLSHVSGPVTIADLAGKTAAAGLQAYVQFLALVSLSLGVLNLLPIPVLDGGHLLYYALEWVRGKPLSQRIQEAGMRFGLAAMLLLMCIAFFNDFTRLFG